MARCLMSIFHLTTTLEDIVVLLIYNILEFQVESLMILVQITTVFLC